MNLDAVGAIALLKTPIQKDGNLAPGGFTGAHSVQSAPHSGRVVLAYGEVVAASARQVLESPSEFLNIAFTFASTR